MKIKINNEVDTSNKKFHIKINQLDNSNLNFSYKDLKKKGFTDSEQTVSIQEHSIHRKNRYMKFANSHYSDEEFKSLLNNS